MRKLLVIISVVLLCGCGSGAPEIKMEVAAEPQQKLSKRISIETHGWVRAGDGNRAREILIIKDTKTGVEYLSVTGCGVTEMVQRGKVAQPE